MTLPIAPPLAPQLARSAAELPTGEWAYEPKWDGFRAIAFVDGEQVYLQSRNGRPLHRYFPEVRFPEGRYVLDGELVVMRGEREDFEALQERIHPAASRITRLAAEIPARYVAFDLLARDDEVLLELPFTERRRALEAFAGDRIAVTPATPERADAERWLHGAEGVVAKEAGAPYRPGERTGMVKVKRVRTMDCVVVGWRPDKREGRVGSLILALYDESGSLRPVGHASGFPAAKARELMGVVAPYETGETGSGEPSRWTADRDLEWHGLRPELVAEVTFDHVSGRRIRHGARLQRLRDDKPPRDCGIEQLDL